ncbi:MAG: hypothetical protein REI64_01150 [Pedobacter sp.]|uniref:hypothetical protein n=1 Tax=Pedobacter sp. TaxID=1411316 RepID=UPI0028095D2A|nr:hypothetical protein [Pedobacter sp.]MDQ8003371.1 hypothetical protein [Pedobacter sp.]
MLAVILVSSCKKKEDQPNEEVFPKYSYEVNCNYCDITYTDASNNTKTLKSNIGNWSYEFPAKVSFELKLNVKTTLSAYQSISAYILKDEEVIYGNLGYNSASISYHTINGNGSSSFGQYIGSGSSGGNSGGGSSTPTSTVCGAKNKSGGYCKRVVAGGGKCWQHK